MNDGPGDLSDYLCNILVKGCEPAGADRAKVRQGSDASDTLNTAHSSVRWFLYSSLKVAHISLNDDDDYRSRDELC